jgi:hypothetical protein
MAMCRLLGWEPESLDEADAGCLWNYGVQQFAPALSPVITPMMQGQIAMRSARGVEIENPETVLRRRR